MLVLTGPAWWSGGLVGSPNAETYGHAWVQWWVAGAWPAWPTGTDLAIGTVSWPVIDALPTWLVGGLSRLVGPTVAWNLWVSVGIVGAGLGGGALARAVGGAPLIGVVGVACAPIWLGSLTSGLTEDVAVGLVAYTLAAALTGRWVLAGALAGVAASFGLYLAWFAGLGLVAIAPFRWRQWRRMILGALLAGVLAAPAAAPFAKRLRGQGHRNAVLVARPEPLWRVNPWRGADLASFGAPGKVDTRDAIVREHPTYLGWSTLGLAALAGPSPAWLAVAGTAAVAVGPTPMWRGQPLGVDNPALRMLAWVPLLDRLNHHARLMLLGNLALVALASRGARRWPRAAPAVVLVELIVLSPARFPLPVTPAASPAIYGQLTALPAGPVLVVGERNPQKALYDQRAHGRPLQLDPNRPGPRAPKRGDIVVAIGASRSAVEAQRGPPTVEAADGAAWLVE